jgi:hypothetical protein
MIRVDFYKLITVTREQKINVAEGVPATETQATKYVKDTKYMYLVSCETQAELDKYVKSRGEHISYDDVTGLPFYYNDKLASGGWSELDFTKDGFPYMKDDLTKAVLKEAKNLGTEGAKVAMEQIWEEKLSDLKILFPKKAKPTFAGITSAVKPVVEQPVEPPVEDVDGL